MKVKEFLETVELPSGVIAQAKEGQVIISGPKGSITKHLAWPGVEISTETNKISLKINHATKNEKKMLCNEIFQNLANFVCLALFLYVECAFNIKS